MATIQELMLRAQLLRQETAVDSISPERAGGIMYDTLSYINEMQLQGANPLLISKIYASVAAMEADSAPVSDLTGKPLRPGQVVCIVPDDETDPDYGMIYRYDGTTGGASSWTAVGRLGSYPYLEGYQYISRAVLTPTPTDPGVPTQKVFYIAYEPGIYTNFDSLVVEKGEVAIFKYNGNWSKELTGAISNDVVKFVENPEYLMVWLDDEGKFLFGIDKDGNLIGQGAAFEYFNAEAIKTEDIEIGDTGMNRLRQEFGAALPAYYYENDYIQNKVKGILNLIMQMGRGDFFGFITDTHPQRLANKHSGQIYKYISDKTPLKKVLFGGDIGTLKNSDYEEGTTPMDAAIYSEIEHSERLDAPIKGILDIFRARGNHDYVTSAGGTEYSEDSWQAGRKATRHFIVNGSNPFIVSDDSRDDACYYYFDNQIQKIRYIVADTSDWTDTKTGTTNVTMKMSDAQIVWLVENAILTTPAGYKIVVMSHVPLAELAYIYNDNVKTEPTIKRLKNILCAVNQRASLSVPMYQGDQQPITYDFSTMQADVVLCVAGHLHGDAETFEDNICFYTSDCDRLRNRPLSYVERQLFGITYPTRVGGTIYEDVLNVVVMDVTNSAINIVRFGTGVNKIFRTTPIIVSAGGTEQMVSSLTAPVIWKCYDAVGSSSDPDDTQSADSGNAFLNTHATINASTGVLTAISAGGVVVAAYSQNDNTIEFFNVIVE